MQIRAAAAGSQAGGYVVGTANAERAANIRSMGNTPTLVTAGFASVTSTWVFPIAGGQTKTFRLNGSVACRSMAWATAPSLPARPPAQPTGCSEPGGGSGSGPI